MELVYFIYSTLMFLTTYVCLHCAVKLYISHTSHCHFYRPQVPHLFHKRKSQHVYYPNAWIPTDTKAINARNDDTPTNAPFCLPLSCFAAYVQLRYVCSGKGVVLCARVHRQKVTRLDVMVV